MRERKRAPLSSNHSSFVSRSVLNIMLRYVSQYRDDLVVTLFWLTDSTRRDDRRNVA